MKKLSQAALEDLDFLRRRIQYALGEFGPYDVDNDDPALGLLDALALAEEARDEGDAEAFAVFASRVGVQEISILFKHDPPPAVRIELLRRLQLVLERMLGEETFRRLRGDFAIHPATNRYALVRHLLANAVFTEGRPQEALEEWRAVYSLTSHRDFGARFGLLPLALALGRDDLVVKLFHAHKDDARSDTVFAWCRVLDRWKARDFKAVRKALAAARAINPHVEAYLVGIRKESFDPMADRIKPGTATEAKTFAPLLLYAWQSHPGALAWLREEPRGPWHRRTPQRMLDPGRWAVPKEDTDETENEDAEDAAGEDAEGKEEGWAGEDLEAWIPEKR